MRSFESRCDECPYRDVCRIEDPLICDFVADLDFKRPDKYAALDGDHVMFPDEKEGNDEDER